MIKASVAHKTEVAFRSARERTFATPVVYP